MTHPQAFRGDSELPTVDVCVGGPVLGFSPPIQKPEMPPNAMHSSQSSRIRTGDSGGNGSQK